MDLRAYYQKMREVEREIAGEDTVVISVETPDGGKGGVATEVPKRLAAKMVVEGRAKLADGPTAKAFREKAAEAKRAADELAAANKLQVSLVSTNELQRLRGAASGKKGPSDSHGLV
jgi:hypothetical protein